MSSKGNWLARIGGPAFALLLGVFGWAPLAAQSDYAELFEPEIDRTAPTEVREPEHPANFVMGDWGPVVDRADYFAPGSGAVALDWYIRDLNKAAEDQRSPHRDYVHLSLVTLPEFAGDRSAFAVRAEEIRQIFSKNEVHALVLYDVAGKRSTAACALTELSSAQCTLIFTEAFAAATGDRYAKFEAGLSALHAVVLHSPPSAAVLCSESLLCQLTDWNSEKWGETWLELGLLAASGLVTMAVVFYVLSKYAYPVLMIAYAGLVTRGWFQFFTVTPIFAFFPTIAFFLVFDEYDISMLFVPAFAGAMVVLVLIKAFLMFTPPGERIRQSLDSPDLPRIFPEK